MFNAYTPFSLTYISYLCLRDSRRAEGLMAGNSRLRHLHLVLQLAHPRLLRDSCVLRPSHAFLLTLRQASLPIHCSSPHRLPQMTSSQLSKP